MGFATGVIKYFLFIFNFIFVLCGLALVIIGILIRSDEAGTEKIIQGLGAFATVLIIVGAIIFIIAFFGCCGAIRENHCMVIVYACVLLTILFVQVAVAIWIFVQFNNVDNLKIEEIYSETFKNYWNENQPIIDTIQNQYKCCGINGPRDYNTLNGTIPWSCCGIKQGSFCSSSDNNVHEKGCLGYVKEFLRTAVKTLGGTSLGVAAVELIGIICVLYFANSIRNADRRGYRV